MRAVLTEVKNHREEALGLSNRYLVIGFSPALPPVSLLPLGLELRICDGYEKEASATG